MARSTRYVNGILTTVDMVGELDHYHESIPVTTAIGVAGTGYDSAHLVFTLPNSETYNGTIDELEVYANGVRQVEGIDFNYENSIVATTITFSSPQPQGRRVTFVKTKGI